MLDFNVKEFCQNLKATKPPYQCPFEGCDRTYKSHLGIRFHLYNFDHQSLSPSSAPFSPKTPSSQSNKKEKSKDKDMDKDKSDKKKWHHRQIRRSPTPPDFLMSPTKETLSYSEAQRMVEFDLDGRIHRININEPMTIIKLESLNGLAEEITKNIEETPVVADKKSGKGRNGTQSGKSGKQAKSGSQKANKGSKGSEEAPKLPEPSFRIIENYNNKLKDAPRRPASYFRFIEKSPDELDEEIEYDMDEEDCAWLDIVNNMRKKEGAPSVTPDVLEYLMDRLEKESYFQSQNTGAGSAPPIDEDAVCCICNDGECQNSNAILFCDMCNLAVHQECYGVPYIPEGQWLCRRCLQSPSRGVDCVLCPNKGGAFKQTDDGRWAHVVCALWIPEVCFANTVFLEPIDSINNIPTARWKLTCIICKQRNNGACIQCHKSNCYSAFHVTCAQQAGLYMKMEAVKERTSSGIVTNVKKAAYCFAHTPDNEQGTSLNGVYSSGEEDSRLEARRPEEEKKLKEKIKKARKILAEKRDATPVISIPTIPQDRLAKIASTINLPKRNQFIQRLLGYWTLKRQSRNGVPLLRRLQISYPGRPRFEASEENADQLAAQMKEELKYWQRLRQDLERARLLVELIRKREKLKREILKVQEAAMYLQLEPFNVFMRRILDLLKDRDKDRIFWEPVDILEVPDYLNFIERPMDFSTMRKRIDSFHYRSFEDFEKDFYQIISNCMTYNEKSTIFYQKAVQLRDFGRLILNEAKERIAAIGIDESTGLHSPHFSIEQIEHSQPSTNTFTGISEEEERLRAKLQQLQSDLEAVRQLKSGGSRTKRIHNIQKEITSVTRELSLLNPTSFRLVDENGHQIVSNSAHAKAGRIDPARNPLRTPDRQNKDEDSTPLKADGRRTMNSVSAAVFPAPLGSSKSNKESPRKRKAKAQEENNSENIMMLNGDVRRRSPTRRSSRSESPTKSNKSPVRSPSRSLEGALSPMAGSTQNAFSSVAPDLNQNSLSDALSGTKRKAGRSSNRPSKRFHSEIGAGDAMNNFAATSLAQKESFREYRQYHSSESDSRSVSSEESDFFRSSGSRSTTPTSGRSTPLSRPDSRMNGSKRPLSRSSQSSLSMDNTQQLIPLEPNDLVWAKCRGYPWYPALIISPDIPKTGYAHNGVAIPIPPAEVLALRQSHQDNHYLVLFFDAKRTWQWLPRSKLEPLGVHDNRDKAKLTEPKKPTEKKAVKKAFERAILHKCKVSGETIELSDSSNE